MVVFRVLIVAYFCDLWFLVVFGVLNFAYFCDLQIAVFWDVKFCLFFNDFDNLEENRCRNGMFGYEMTQKMMNFGEKCSKALHYTLLSWEFKKPPGLP